MGQALKKNKIVRHDIALLKIKRARDATKIYVQQIENKLEEEHLMAVKLIKSGYREKAKTLLRRKLILKSYLQDVDKQLENLKQIVVRLDTSQLHATVVEGIKASNDTLRSVNSVMNIKYVENILLESPNGFRKQKEIDHKIDGLQLSNDEVLVEEELEAIIQEHGKYSFPSKSKSLLNTRKIKKHASLIKPGSSISKNPACQR